MVLVVTHQISVRLRYVLREIFEANHNIEIVLVTLSDFLHWEKPLESQNSLKSIFYYETNWEHGISTVDTLKNKIQQLALDADVVHLKGNSLLMENGIDVRWENPPFTELTTSLSFRLGEQKTDKLPVLFPIESSELGYDPFSMVFWILSRYEENLWYIKKSRENVYSKNPLAHRFSAKESHAYQNQYLDKPVVDWVRLHLISLAGYSSTKEIQLRKQTYKIIPTADIDMFFKFGKRTAIRNIGSWLLSLKNPRLVYERLIALLSGKDPLDPQYTTLPLLESSDFSKCFLLLSEKHDPFHKQNSLDKKSVKQSIATIFKRLNPKQVGIHPSIVLHQFSENSSIPAAWTLEAKRFNSFSNQKTIHASRFHYLNFFLPRHYEWLESMGISEDWSMGYHDLIGFRASTSFAFAWYNLTQEKQTHLMVVPFQSMDVTCKNYMSLTNELSITYIDSIKQSIEFIGGMFVFIFHNESVSESYPWTGWRKTISAWNKS